MTKLIHPDLITRRAQRALAWNEHCEMFEKWERFKATCKDTARTYTAWRVLDHEVKELEVKYADWEPKETTYH